MSARSSPPDVLIIGDGVIGLATALAIARAGGSCRILGRTIAGAASAASAGLLAPSIGTTSPSIRSLMRAARDRYPEWLRWLAERTGVEVTLNRLGIIEIGTDITADAESDVSALDAHELASMEPALTPVSGAILHHHDGFVDNLQLLAAMREAVRCEWSIDVADGRVATIEPLRHGCSVTLEDGRKQHGESAVIAAGAWSALISGVPRPIPVEPVRGQMLRINSCPLTHAVSSPDAYLVPRRETVLVGSTLERAGFDSSTTQAALSHLRRAACAVVPRLADCDVLGGWAGLRPLTPDGLPILGRDPEIASLIYACGHGKNGILLAPITAECVAAIVSGGAAPMDFSAFDIQRFG
jgi:glycine oxidase